jgi:hypothetical protein
LNVASLNIHQGAKIESDNACGYKKPLAQIYFHVFEIYDPESDQPNWTHKVISNFKAMIAGTYHGNEKTHTALYAAEFCYIKGVINCYETSRSTYDSSVHIFNFC